MATSKSDQRCPVLLVFTILAVLVLVKLQYIHLMQHSTSQYGWLSNMSQKISMHMYQLKPIHSTLEMQVNQAKRSSRRHCRPLLCCVSFLNLLTRTSRCALQNTGLYLNFKIECRVYLRCSGRKRIIVHLKLYVQRDVLYTAIVSIYFINIQDIKISLFVKDYQQINTTCHYNTYQ